jgi:hypothetical protein
MDAESAPLQETTGVIETMSPLVATSVAPRVAAHPVRSLSTRLHLPSSLMSWLLGPEGAPGSSATATTAALSTSTSTTAGLAGWMQSLAAALSQSGLFFETQLREHRAVPVADLKRRLLEFIESRRAGPESAGAWSALDDLVGLQSAATAASRSGGTVFSFVFPSPDGFGGWWITLHQDPSEKSLDYSEGDGRRDDRQKPWRTRLVGVSLPFGEIDIRIEQVGRSGVGVTVLTDTADQQARWEESKDELARRLRGAGLELARWSVIEPQLDVIPRVDPGQLHSVRV